MKKKLFILATGILLLAGCTGVRTLTTGLENEAFLLFIGSPLKYDGGVDVNVDDKLSFKAEVQEDHATRPKGKVYAISTGTHVVSVSHNNNVIYRKQIVVSVQETKKIILP
jgi:hypothetical protein